MTPLDYLAVACACFGWVPLGLFISWRLIKLVEWLGLLDDENTYKEE